MSSYFSWLMISRPQQPAASIKFESNYINKQGTYIVNTDIYIYRRAFKGTSWCCCYIAHS